ncbi:MAG: cyclopropane-fatty-acyl-phospholipid synthase family protein [Woeseia sp.]
MKRFSEGLKMTMQVAANRAVDWTEQGLVPDAVIRHGIRRLLKQRLVDIHADDCEMSSAALSGFVEMMKQSPIALVPELANEQHYEVPAAFFAEVLGDHRKYSCCFWPDGCENLTEAEAEALRITAERAALKDGQKVLDLGCGWGSMSLWIARRYPGSHVTAVSNSQSQRDHIVAEASRRGLTNLKVLVQDMNDFDPVERFDRIVSIEMFEHMRNYELLFARVASWLTAEGFFFMHIFSHRSTPYEFVDKGPNDWMSRHFFSGGIMPSSDLPLLFQKHLHIEERWRWSGLHYAKTSNKWLERMDERRDQIMPILRDTYGAGNAQIWWQRWRIFFMACAELFAYRNGEEWYVSHYRFGRRHDAK